MADGASDGEAVRAVPGPQVILRARADSVRRPHFSRKGIMSNELSVIQPSAPTLWTEDREAVELVKRTVADGLNDTEFRFFLAVCKRTGLDPLAKQIYAIQRYAWDPRLGQTVPKLTIQTGIDGFRLIAERTGRYQGQLGPLWCGMDGVWHDHWLGDGPPAACKIAVMRVDFAEPLWAVAHFREYAQWFKNKKTGQMELADMWARMPANQIAKVAEALALRRAFPQELSGLYAREEMEQADSREEAADTAQRVAEAKLAKLKAEPPVHQPEVLPPADPPAPKIELQVTSATLREMMARFQGLGHFERLKEFQAMKPRVGGESVYRHILAEKFGGVKSDKLGSPQAEVSFYQELLDVYMRWSAAEEMQAKLDAQVAADCIASLNLPPMWVADAEQSRRVFRALRDLVRAQEDAAEAAGGQA